MRMDKNLIEAIKRIQAGLEELGEEWEVKNFDLTGSWDEAETVTVRIERRKKK